MKPEAMSNKSKNKEKAELRRPSLGQVLHAFCAGDFTEGQLDDELADMRLVRKGDTWELQLSCRHPAENGEAADSEYPILCRCRERAKADETLRVVSPEDDVISICHVHIEEDRVDRRSKVSCGVRHIGMNLSDDFEPLLKVLSSAYRMAERFILTGKSPVWIRLAEMSARLGLGDEGGTK